MAFVYSDQHAAQVLASGLREIERIEVQKRQYPYEYPQHLLDEEHRAAESVRSAVRWFVLGDLDEEG